MPSSTKPKINDVLFTRVGSNLGNPVVLEDNIEFGIFVSLGFFRIKNKLKNPFYLKNWILSNYFWKQVNSKVAGGAKNNLNTGWLKEFKIVLPSNLEQEKISDFLSLIDKKIELLEEKLNSLKLFNIGVFQKYYNNTKFIKLKKISKLQGGFAFESKKYISSGIPIIKITNVEDEINFKNSNFSHYPNIQIDKKFKVDYNDILIAMSGATTGKIGRYKESQYSYLNQRVGKFIVNTKEINSEYFYHFLKSYYFKKELNKFLVAGAQPNISNNDIDNIKISLPDIITQNKIGSILQKIDTNIFLLNSKINKYKTFKKGLLQQMFI
jgi:type I restriction enzyme S subunit